MQVGGLDAQVAEIHTEPTLNTVKMLPMPPVFRLLGSGSYITVPKVAVIVRCDQGFIGISKGLTSL